MPRHKSRKVQQSPLNTSHESPEQSTLKLRSGIVLQRQSSIDRLEMKKRKEKSIQQKLLNTRRKNVFQFLELPPEIRNKIYHYMFHLDKDSAHVILYHFNPLPMDEGNADAPKNITLQPCRSCRVPPGAIVSTCKQIFAETQGEMAPKPTFDP